MVERRFLVKNILLVGIKALEFMAYNLLLSNASVMDVKYVPYNPWFILLRTRPKGVFVP